MNKRPGHVVVTTEVGFCSFCGRPRNLRNEAHQLGTLVRTIVTCETCHRTLSSTIGVAAAQPEAEAEAVPAVAEPETAAEPEPAPAKPPAKPSAKRKPAATKSTPTKTRATKKTK
jgi:hypothetical protein